MSGLRADEQTSNLLEAYIRELFQVILPGTITSARQDDEEMW